MCPLFILKLSNLRLWTMASGQYLINILSKYCHTCICILHKLSKDPQIICRFSWTSLPHFKSISKFVYHTINYSTILFTFHLLEPVKGLTNRWINFPIRSHTEKNVNVVPEVICLSLPHFFDCIVFLKWRCPPHFAWLQELLNQPKQTRLIL